MSSTSASPGHPGAAGLALSRAGPGIEVAGLSKSFGDVRAVDALSFSAEPGEVTGFLGPNGAGKTTTLRMLLGLVEPTGGRATIGGARYVDLDRPADVVGAALEASSFHPGRSGRDHLRVYCAVNGYPDSRAVEVLALVGLTEAARRPVRGSRSGCGSAWGWRRRSLVTRQCSCSMSRPTGWTRLASPGSAGS